MARKQGDIPVIVTTEHRGVFFGWTDPAKIHGEQVRLTRARLCVCWSSDVKGFMGLASTGPTKACRIGPEVKAITLRKITAVMDVEPAAVTAWGVAPWNG